MVIMKTLSKFKLITLKYFTIKSEKMKSFNFLFLIILTHLFGSLYASRPIEIKNSQCIKITSGYNSNIKEDCFRFINQNLEIQSGNINVKDFGAKGDGQTDDTEAVTKACNSSFGGLVEFPAGSYRITKTINILLSENGPTGITGSGGTARVIMEGTGPAFRFRGSHQGSASPATVTDLTWDKERMPMVEAIEIVGKNPCSNGLEFQHTHMPVIRAVLIRDVNHGIYLTSRNRNVIISNCHIYNCKGIGVYLDSVNLHQIIISDSHISYCKQGGIKVNKSEIRNFQITGNDIEYNYDEESTSVADIWVDCSEKGSVREGTISGNTIQAIPSPGGANIRFTGPRENNRQIGLWSITGNHLSNHTVIIHLSNTQGISIAGNTILRAYEHHMIIENSRNILLSGNVFDYNPDYFRKITNAYGGITIANSNNIIVSENIVDGVKYGNSDKGGAVNIIESSEVSVRGCHISNPEYRGIDVENSSDIYITDCSISCDTNNKSMISGIELRGTCNATIVRNNKIGLTKEKGIINHASGVIIEKNYSGK